MAKLGIKVKSQSNSVNDFVQYLKALIVSLIVSFAGILIFALIIKLTNMSDGWIVPINLIIKAISVAVGMIIYTKSRSGGLKKGIILAVSYITLSFVVFSALSGDFSFSWTLLLDYVFSILVGAIVGIIRVNKK